MTKFLDSLKDQIDRSRYSMFPPVQPVQPVYYPVPMPMPVLPNPEHGFN
jgi:hypothetical protein